jgi:polyisoprenyl-teichoic acid--peptidoglycan teichoic acid transferase
MSRRAWAIFLGLLTVLLLAAAGVSWTLYNNTRNYVAGLTIPNIEFLATPRPVVNATADPLTLPLPKPWNGKERINILLMGIDERSTNETEHTFRTDTMIVLTVDPITMKAGMLSIPRDLWVPIPGYGANNRINFANQWGDGVDYPGGGGPQLARKTVESVLGIRVHHYVRLNFTVFESFIDRLGGVEVVSPQDIYDTEYPTEDFRTELFELKAGKHVLDGETALKYARTRHDKNGDFGRAQRQQQVILAIKDRVKDPRVFASLVASAPELIEQFGGAIKTDLTLDQIQQLAALAQKLDRANITSAVLDFNYTELATTPEGYSVLLARREKIAELREQFFGG